MIPCPSLECVKFPLTLNSIQQLLFNFDKTPTVFIVVFEAFIILATISSLLLISKIRTKMLLRYSLVFIGVFLFESFTAPMWNNLKLGFWAYVYRDVSWILTLAWSTLIFTTVTIVDYVYPQWREWKKFLLYIPITTFIGIIGEITVVGLGIRTYAPEVLSSISGYYFINIPIEAFYYMPVFMILTICFYKYFSLYIDRKPLIPVKKKNWVRDFFIASIGVFFFELMVEPMAVNAKFPTWSYLYHDISVFTVFLWVAIIAISTTLVDKIGVRLDVKMKFFCYLAVGEGFALPIESWLINHGYRVYGSSAVANYSGFTTIITHLPIEIVFAIPFYLALIICFARFWEIAIDNKL